MSDEFYRIQRLPPYVFAEVNAMKAAARGRGEDIVDLGMGNPDGMPPPHVIAKLAEVAPGSTLRAGLRRMAAVLAQVPEPVSHRRGLRGIRRAG